VDSSKKAEIWESVLKDNLQLMLAGDRFDVSDATVLWSVVLNDSGVELFRSIATHLADQSEDYGRMLESFHASVQRQKERRVELRTPRNKSGEALPPPKTLEQFMETMPTLSPLAWKKYTADFLKSSGDNSERIAELLEKPISEASRKSILYLMLVDSKHFSGESYPRDPQPLIDELNKYAPQNTPIDTQEKRFARDLSKLISRIRHPAVREHALRRIELKKTLSYSSAIDLFTVYTFLMNYDESNAEDEALLMSLIKDEEDEFTAHSNGMDLIELSRDFPDGTHVPEPLMNHLMLFIYESTPCPNCKARAASYLMSENNRSFSRENKLELAREMIHDSVGTLRAIAGSFLS
ncbi:MAG: hypothetical protein IJY04_02210, partial [Clostridia bacterium]|nr:hypothetical protein [Clostridia bacterium]